MTTLNLQTRLYKVDDEEGFNGGKREQGMLQFDLLLSTTKEMSWEAKRVNVPGSFTRGNWYVSLLPSHVLRQLKNFGT
jgi:hypothetical protein